jgi:hypothetical protein
MLLGAMETQERCGTSKAPTKLAAPPTRLQELGCGLELQVPNVPKKMIVRDWCNLLRIGATSARTSGHRTRPDAAPIQEQHQAPSHPCIMESTRCARVTYDILVLATPAPITKSYRHIETAIRESM